MTEATSTTPEEPHAPPQVSGHPTAQLPQLRGRPTSVVRSGRDDPVVIDRVADPPRLGCRGRARRAVLGISPSGDGQRIDLPASTLASPTSRDRIPGLTRRTTLRKANIQSRQYRARWKDPPRTVRLQDKMVRRCRTRRFGAEPDRFVRPARLAIDRSSVPSSERRGVRVTPPSL